MSWWKQKRYRMIQNNLRDIDAGMDLDAYVKTLKEFQADVCMVGCGGITAFYPTRLDCQKMSPYLKDDFLGNLLKKCHENEIRVIARFDFSKTHSDFVRIHPEWYSKSVDGNYILYHDTAATCVNGDYQQEYALKILEEVISEYPVDGVFFNMFGYQTRDYSGNYVGICQCDNCRRRFKEYSGHELPVEENENDPVFSEYKKFKSDTTEGLLKRIYLRVKELNPEVAVCTYSNRYVDLVRNESNSAVDRPYPFWAMASENNSGCVQGSFEDRYSSNCVINAADIFYRFMGVSPYLNELRLWGDLAAGGNLDWCIIGSFETYPDKVNYEGVKRVFAFQKKYEKYYNNLKSCSSVLVVWPMDATLQIQKEYLGIYKMLKEEHIPFDVLDGRETGILEKKAQDYGVIILPGVETLPDSTMEALEESKAVLVGTGLALKENPKGLERLFGISMGQKLEQVRGSYMLTEPKEIFTHFADRDWVYLDKDYYYVTPKPENRNYMPLILAGKYGPPERCFGNTITEQSCVSVRPGKSIYFPWMPGSVYEAQGYEDHKNLFLDVLRADALSEERIKISAPPCVEVFIGRCSEREYLVQLLNYSGFNGTTFYEPLAVEVEITFSDIDIERVQFLKTPGKSRPIRDGKMKVCVKGLYEAVLIRECKTIL